MKLKTLEARHASLWLAVAGGLCHALAFPPVEFPAAAALAVVLLLLSIDGRGVPAAVFRGWIYGMVFLFVGCFWIMCALGPLGALLIPLAAVFTALFAGLVAHRQGETARPSGAERGPAEERAPDGGSMEGVGSSRRGLLSSTLFVAAAWVACEFLRAEVWPLRNASHALGFATPDGAFLMLARWGGVFGLSFLVAWWGALLHAACRRRGGERLGALLLLVLSLGGACAAGRWLAVPSVDTGSGVAVRFVQAHKASFDELLALSRSATAGTSEPVVVVWPENARRDFLLEDSKGMARIEAFCRGEDAALLLGARKRGAGGQRWNTALGFDRAGRHAGDFSKRCPVPFVEWRIAPSSDGAPVPLDGARWGPVICYDADFSFVARELVREGAQIMTTPTLDAPHWGATQHRQRGRMLRLRAVETGRWWVRVATDGPSFVMDPRGRIRGPVLDVGARGWGGGRVWPRDERTPYVRFGWMLPWVCLVVSAGFGVRLSRGAAPSRRACAPACP